MIKKKEQKKRKASHGVNIQDILIQAMELTKNVMLITVNICVNKNPIKL